MAHRPLSPAPSHPSNIFSHMGSLLLSSLCTRVSSYNFDIIVITGCPDVSVSVKESGPCDVSPRIYLSLCASDPSEPLQWETSLGG